jgi:hypothetical protein
MEPEVPKPALIAHFLQLPLPVRAQSLVGPTRADAKIIHAICGALYLGDIRLNDALGRGLGTKAPGDEGDDAEQQPEDWRHWGIARVNRTRA